MNKALFKSLFSMLFIFLCLCFGQEANAQTRGFSKDPAVYITELGEHVKAAKKPEVSEIYDKFKTQWLSGIYNEDQQSLVIRISEYMLLNKFDIDPDFALYMKTLLVARDSNISVQKFDNWIAETYKLIKSNRKAYLTVLQTSYNVFKDRALVVEKSKTWSFNNADFKFIFKGNDVQIELKLIDLKCKGPGDEINIYGTGGIYNMMDQTWRGKGGTVNWTRVGIKSSEAFAKLKDYRIDMTRGEFSADSVTFQYNGVLNEKVDGKFTDKISSGYITDKEQDFSNSSYPRFEAWRKDLTINKFDGEDIKFKGGFAIEGNQIRGIGNKDNKATFEFYYKGKKTISASSSNFNFGAGRISSLAAEMTIYTDSGTIYHPMIKMSYVKKDTMLVFTRGDKGLEQAPFFDTDHDLEIWVDQIIWRLGDPKIDFDMISNDSRARFESKNYYREFTFEKLTQGGMMNYHPITKMYQYIVQTRARTFLLADYARSIGSKKENMYSQMFLLADEGFIYYDLETEMITPKEKLFNYYKNHYKLADYDIIRFSSVIAARSNATLNLINYDLRIDGIAAFRFSDSQNVVVVPREQIVTVKNNRRMIFDGTITAGRFDFFGEKFDFNYGNFTVTSEKIDSMKLFYPDSVNQKYLVPIKTVLRDLNGILYIDKSDNKSGLTDHPEYPIFVSRTPSVIAYDKKHIFNGAYKKETFRFEVDPFTIDSMDNFTISGLRFPGTFVSAGILPEFKYEASIMKDYSLGFKKSNPPGGYTMYEGKGHGEIDISMSEEGLWAKGEIEYQGAKMKSSKIVMMPDSLNADVDEYSIKKNGRFPRLMALDVKTHWMPKQEEMYINTNNHDVDIFENGQVFNGNMKHTPSELSGNGKLMWDNAILTSTEIKFAPVLADAAVSKIQIGDVDAGKISFVSTNVKSHIDFEKRTGDFTANELGHVTQLAYNQFTSTMDDFKWDMDKKTILMTATGRAKTEEYVFKSTNPVQDGLSFISTKALFDMNTGIIYAEEIPYIDVADSRIFAFEGKAVIEKDAFIRTLNQSKLLASRKEKYHELYDCKINVLGRNALGGEGLYEYQDKHRTGQIIHFTSLRVLRDTTVQALGNMKDSVGFTISPKIAYKGEIELNSNKPFLQFNGYVLPLHTFRDYTSIWFRYNDRQNPGDIIINTKEPKNEEKKNINVSMNFSPVDSVNVYPTFFNFKRTYSDLEITTDNGIMLYDERLDAFVAGDSNKVLNGALRGNMLTFGEGDRMISSEGKLNLDLNFHKNYDILTAGKVWKQESDTAFTIETIMAINLKLPDECYARIQDVLEKNGADAPSISLSDPILKRSLAEFIDDKKFDKIIGDIETGDLKSIGDLNRDFLITHAEFFYSQPLKALVSVSNIDLAGVKGKSVNRSYKSRMLYESKKSGARFVFYFEVSKYDWFYFEFQRGNFYVYSTDKAFNDAIIQKSKKINEKGYTLRPASPVKVSRQIEKIDALTGS